MLTQRDEFVPGTAWTPERIRESVDRMLAVLASPEMQQALDAAAEAAEPDGTAASVADAAAAAAGITAPEERSSRAIDPARVIYRRARPGDVPQIAAMMLAEHLPPLFIEEWLPGFVVVEHEGEIIGCGGNEIYEDSCVIRSIAVDPRGRRSGVARTITELLLADARAHGVTDAYLFTVDAYPFWLRLGFVDVELENWKAAARQNWQYWYISTHPGVVEGVHSMWKRIDG